MLDVGGVVNHELDWVANAVKRFKSSQGGFKRERFSGEAGIQARRNGECKRQDLEPSPHGITTRYGCSKSSEQWILPFLRSAYTKLPSSRMPRCERRSQG